MTSVVVILPTFNAKYGTRLANGSSPQLVLVVTVEVEVGSAVLLESYRTIPVAFDGLALVEQAVIQPPRSQ